MHQHVINGLLEKRSELAGLLDHHRKEVERLMVELGHLDTTIKIFNPDASLRVVKPRKYRDRISYFRRGECQRLVLDVLRDANQALTSRQIAQAIIKRRKLTETPFMTEQIQKVVIGSLKGVDKRGTVIQGELDGSSRTWKINYGQSS